MGEFWSRGALLHPRDPRSRRETRPPRVHHRADHGLPARGQGRGAPHKKIGNAHVFEATTSRASVQTRLLKELLGLFGGNARPVMAHLVEMGKISSEDIEDAQKLLRAHTAKDQPARTSQMIAALINHLWQSTLFCGGAWLITLALRANSAALRHWLWLLASAEISRAVLAAVLPRARSSDCPQRASPTTSRCARRRSAKRVRAGFAGRAAGGRPARAPTVLIVLCCAIWLGGALVVGLRWLLAWRAANSIVRAARPAPGAPPDARITDADIEPAVARRLSSGGVAAGRAARETVATRS